MHISDAFNSATVVNYLMLFNLFLPVYTENIDLPIKLDENAALICSHTSALLQFVWRNAKREPTILCYAIVFP